MENSLHFIINDFVYIAIILVFTIVAAIRGVIKEILGKVAWVLGLLFALIFADKLNVYMAKWVHIEIVGLILSFLAIFAVVFLVVQIIKVILDKIFSGEVLGSLNHALGLFIGLIEGSLIVLSIIFAICKVPFLKNHYFQDGIFYTFISPLYNSKPAAEQNQYPDNQEILSENGVSIQILNPEVLEA